MIDFKHNYFETKPKPEVFKLTDFSTSKPVEIQALTEEGIKQVYELLPKECVWSLKTAERIYYKSVMFYCYTIEATVSEVFFSLCSPSEVDKIMDHYYQTSRTQCVIPEFAERRDEFDKSTVIVVEPVFPEVLYACFPSAAMSVLNRFELLSDDLELYDRLFHRMLYDYMYNTMELEWTRRPR